MEPTREQAYQRRIAELEAGNADLKALVAELRAQVARLSEQIAKLSENSSNSSKPPSSDIVKPSRPASGKKTNSKKTKRKIGGQPGHAQHERPPFSPEEIDDVREYRLNCCPDCGGVVNWYPQEADDHRKLVVGHIPHRLRQLTRIQAAERRDLLSSARHLHRYESNVEPDVVSNDPGILQRGTHILGDQVEPGAVSDIPIADAVDAVGVGWDWPLRIHKPRQTPTFLLALSGRDADFDDPIAHGWREPRGLHIQKREPSAVETGHCHPPNQTTRLHHTTLAPQIRPSWPARPPRPALPAGLPRNRVVRVGRRRPGLHNDAPGVNLTWPRSATI